MKKCITILVLWCSLLSVKIVWAQWPDFPLPVMGGEELKCSQGNNNSYTHHGRLTYAWDFNLYGSSGDGDMGLPAVSSTDGRVTFAADFGGEWGKCVVISCNWCEPQNRAILIAHLDQIFVKVGEVVKRGQVVGLLGKAVNDAYHSAHIHYQFQDGMIDEESGQYTDIHGNPLVFSNPNFQSRESLLVYKLFAHSAPDEVGSLESYCSENARLISTNNQMVELRHCENSWLNPYSDHTSDHLPCRVFGEKKAQENGRMIHWWHPPSFGQNYRSDMYFSDGTAKNCYIQEYFGKSGGAPWNGSIVCDFLGGARHCYIVGWWQWDMWHTLDSPDDMDSTFDPEEHEGGPASHCGMPITDSYYTGNGNWRQDFQKCFLVHDRIQFWPQVAPGWFEEGMLTSHPQEIAWNRFSEENRNNNVDSIQAFFLDVHQLL